MPHHGHWKDQDADIDEDIDDSRREDERIESYAMPWQRRIPPLRHRIALEHVKKENDKEGGDVESPNDVVEYFECAALSVDKETAVK